MRKKEKQLPKQVPFGTIHFPFSSLKIEKIGNSIEKALVWKWDSKK